MIDGKMVVFPTLQSLKIVFTLAGSCCSSRPFSKCQSLVNLRGETGQYKAVRTLLGFCSNTFVPKRVTTQKTNSFRIQINHWITNIQKKTISVNETDKSVKEIHGGSKTTKHKNTKKDANVSSMFLGETGKIRLVTNTSRSQQF